MTLRSFCQDGEYNKTSPQRPQAEGLSRSCSCMEALHSKEAIEENQTPWVSLLGQRAQECNCMESMEYFKI